MPAKEYSDRHKEDRERPMLNATAYVSEDGTTFQFLVTVRGNRRDEIGVRTPAGRIRAAIIAEAERHDIDVAIAGHPRYAAGMGEKRG